MGRELGARLSLGAICLATGCALIFGLIDVGRLCTSSVPYYQVQVGAGGLLALVYYRPKFSRERGWGNLIVALCLIAFGAVLITVDSLAVVGAFRMLGLLPHGYRYVAVVGLTTAFTSLVYARMLFRIQKRSPKSGNWITALWVTTVSAALFLMLVGLQSMEQGLDHAIRYSSAAIMAILVPLSQVIGSLVNAERTKKTELKEASAPLL